MRVFSGFSIATAVLGAALGCGRSGVELLDGSDSGGSGGSSSSGGSGASDRSGASGASGSSGASGASGSGGTPEVERLTTRLAAGPAHACVIDREGALYCWGDNRYGQLGDGTQLPRAAPVR